MSVEWLSIADSTLIAGYAENIQRYAFAASHCIGKRVLDAGCGSGYGAFYLAENGARFVLAVDKSRGAIEEAKTHYRKENLRYGICDIELPENAIGGERFEVVVNFENLAHLKQPERLLELVSQVAASNDLIFIVSTPNGRTTPTDETGRPTYRFQHRAYGAEDLELFLSSYFDRVAMYGQWLTHAGMLRKMRAREAFDHLCEQYYNPFSRLGRLIKRLAGKNLAAAPTFNAAADSFPSDHDIRPLSSNAYPWAPRTLLAVCGKMRTGPGSQQLIEMHD